MITHVTNLEKVIRAALYQRISLDRAGDEHGVTNQRDDQRRTAVSRGYKIELSESDNDISALTGKHRPGYEKIMAAAGRGEIDVIIVFQLSRFWRNRIERAQGIKILQRANVSIVATRGPSLDMSNAYGRAMAGLLGEFDTMESEVKSEREQLFNESAAKAGRPRKGCPRPFGWQADRVTPDPDEAAAILEACRGLLAGGTVSAIAREWDALRPLLRPRIADGWTRASVRAVLSNPRNAGIMVYRGQEIGRGEWVPLVTEEMFRAVTAILRDKSRRPARGVTTMLGGLALCRCGNYVTGALSAQGHGAYRCNQQSRAGREGPHVHVKRDEVDRAVSAAIVAHLSAPENASRLLAPEPADVSTAALRDEAAVLRHRIARLGELYMEGAITEADLAGGSERGRARLAEIEGELAALGRGSALVPLITAADVGAAWEALGTDRRRAVVGVLMTVMLYPSGRGAREFDPGVVLPVGRGIRWKAVEG